MALARQEQKIWVIKKETVRGTAEADSTGGRAIPVLPASEMSLNPNLIANAKVFGDRQMRVAAPGVRDWQGTMELEPGADKLGELLNSLFGTLATDQPDAGGAPLVYRHRFTPSLVGQNPLYTLFADRGDHLRKYAGVSARQMTFTIPVDNRIAVSCDLLAKSEAPGEALAPDFDDDLEDLLFSDVTVTLAGAPSSQVRQASLQVNANTVAKRVLGQSRDAADIVSGMLDITGAFQLYFEDDTERAKFVASTDTSLKLVAAGQTLQAAQKATLELDCPRIRYTAGPIAEVDGILVQDFAFGAYRDITANYPLRATLINKFVAY